jgi:hypothetical protein
MSDNYIPKKGEAILVEGVIRIGDGVTPAKDLPKPEILNENKDGENNC